MEACVLTPTINEDNIVDDVTNAQAFMHFLTIPLKILFSFLIPPKHWMNGWLTVFCSFSVIGLITIIIADFANILQCTLNLRLSVTAVTILAVGFSFPDIFTSAIAAKYEKRSADAVIAHTMGINAMNFFLGICLPWVYATIYLKDKKNISYDCN